MNKQYLLLSGALALAAGTGYITSTAISSSSQEPSKTVTINVGEPGPKGDTGPQGPPGEPGATSCPAGSTFGAVKFIQQAQGPVTLLGCIQD